MIELGLSRITRLLQNTPQHFKAIHIAGTNGKGTTATHLSALLHATGRSCARFNSPHFLDRWDCLTLNEQPVAEALFLEAEARIKARDAALQIGASEFELLTATAFEIMNRAAVEFGVIEVGMGGALDATNALRSKVATVIAKIGLDHQFLLGNTIEEIAEQKAGIMLAGVPCVVDASNAPSVLRVIEEHAKAVGAEVVYPAVDNKLALEQAGLEPHQVQNISGALEAFRLVCPEQDSSVQRWLPLIQKTSVPGRLQRVNVRGGKELLLDGAHNVQSAEVLASHVNKYLRRQGPVTWVLAASEGKDIRGILEVLIQPGDLVTALRFGPVDGMPWVRPQDPETILQAAESLGAVGFRAPGDGDLGQTVLEAAPSKGHPVVVAGSLYLASDLLRHLRSTSLSSGHVAGH